jgi:hypothetical protein
MALAISSRFADTGKDSGNSIFKGVADKGKTSVKIRDGVRPELSAVLALF